MTPADGGHAETSGTGVRRRSGERGRRGAPGLAGTREAAASDPAVAARFASEAITHECAAELQRQGAESQRDHELEALG
jgi:hypothetical protein